MIVKVCCNQCLSRFDVTITPDDGHLIAQLADTEGKGRCPRQCGGKVNLTNTEDVGAIVHVLKTPLHLTAKEFYAASYGAGLPDEIPQSGELVASLLIANKVQAVETETIGDRIYLHEIHLENGTVIHLAAGGAGAQVFKVTRKHP